MKILKISSKSMVVDEHVGPTMATGLAERMAGMACMKPVALQTMSNIKLAGRMSLSLPMMPALFTALTAMSTAIS